MLFPKVVIVIFWVAIAMTLLTAISDLIHGMILQGLFVFFFGPIFVRLICEFFVVFFSINDTLTDIRHLMAEKTASAESSVD